MNVFRRNVPADGAVGGLGLFDPTRQGSSPHSQLFPDHIRTTRLARTRLPVAVGEARRSLRGSVAVGPGSVGCAVGSLRQRLLGTLSCQAVAKILKLGNGGNGSDRVNVGSDRAEVVDSGHS